MEAIKISKAQRDALCSELDRLVGQYEQYGNVKCIYVIPYKSEFCNDSQLCVEIVRELNGYKYLETNLENYIMKLGESNSVDKYGVEVVPTIGNCEDYFGEKYQMSRRGFLRNAMIMFDRDGYYTKLREEEMEDDSLDFPNTCDFVPPLTDKKEKVHLEDRGLSKRLVRKEK